MEQTIVAPHQRSIEVIQGPKTDENYFRHEDEVIHMEDEMVGAMQEFRIQAVEHNKEFLRKVEEIRDNIKHHSKRIDKETKERKESFKDVWLEAADKFKRTAAELEEQIRQQFQQYYDDHLEPLTEDKKDLERRSDAFYKSYVPNLYRKQIGRVADQMRTQHESFSVENKKVMAREKVIKDNVEEHAKKVQERLQVEKEDRYDQTVVVEERFHYTIKHPQRREEEALHHRMVHEIKGVCDDFSSEHNTREENDKELVQNVEKMMRNIQKTLLQNFAAEDSEDSED